MNSFDCINNSPGRSGYSIKMVWPALLFFGLSLVAGGCVDTYGPGPVYGSAPYAAPYGPGYYGQGYGYGPGVTIAIDDRPYYTRGPGYYVGRSRYVWKPGRWVVRNGQRYWVHGRYVLRS